MDTTAELQKAKSAYIEADPNQKKMLEKIFGKKVFELSLMDRIKTFKDAYQIFKAKKFTDELNLILQKRKESELSTLDKLLIIAEALRGDWIADYDNSEIKKWLFWVEKTSSGWVFYVTYCDLTAANSAVGPRFAQETPEMAKYFFEQFKEEHCIVLNNK